MVNGPLMRSQKPAFEQRDHAMDSGQEMLGPGCLMFPDLALVDVALQLAISLQPVGHNPASHFDGSADKLVQGRPVGIDNVLGSDAPDALPVGLGG